MKQDNAQENTWDNAQKNTQSTTQEQAAIIPEKRADALDALRGLAILAMVFSGTIRYNILPAWMYHAQEPPPTHAFNKTLAGLTWVDLVFPLFLFAMGAAIPFALSRRVAQGWSTPKLILYILKRGALLGAFAIILQHLRPFSIDANPTGKTWALAILGFGLLSFMFGQIPDRWIFSKYRTSITIAAWVAALVLITQLPYGGKGFLLTRSDPILIALANMAVFGAIAWLMTRSNRLLRLGLLGILIALQFASGSEGWVKTLWSASPIPWVFQFYYLKYLFIVIPGTIAGDLIWHWSQQPDRELDPCSAKSQPYILILCAMGFLCLLLLVGLQARWLWQTTLGSIAVCAVVWQWIKPLKAGTDLLIRQFYQWGVYWLILGLCFEPFQGGIKKDPSTYSYYFVTTAIAFFLLIGFTILIDRLQQKRWLQLLIDNGQNPMIAYVAFANLLWGILQLSGLEDLSIAYTNTPILGAVKGVLYTLPIALLTRFFTRQKFFWRT
jgi:predicted acyltransferase